MENNLINRAKVLDTILSTNISELITLEEASSIVAVWGMFLEQIGAVSFLFSSRIPESMLPYPKYLLAGAINKMAEYHHGKGNLDAVKTLESSLFGLSSYINDQDAIAQASESFNNESWREHFLPGLRKLQEDRMENGFLVNGNIWQFSKSRLREIENSLKIIK